MRGGMPSFRDELSIRNGGVCTMRLCQGAGFFRIRPHIQFITASKEPA